MHEAVSVIMKARELKVASDEGRNATLLVALPCTSNWQSRIAPSAFRPLCIRAFNKTYLK